MFKAMRVNRGRWEVNREKVYLNQEKPFWRRSEPFGWAFNYTKDTCQIREHNSLYVFSDGVYEVEKPDGSMWRFQELAGYLQKARFNHLSVLDRLYGHVKEMGNSETLEDDFTILEVVFTNLSMLQLLNNLVPTGGLNRILLRRRRWERLTLK